MTRRPRGRPPPPGSSATTTPAGQPAHDESLIVRRSLLGELGPYMSRMVAVSTLIAASEGLAGALFGEPALFGSAVLTAVFGMTMLAVNGLVRAGRERWAGLVLAASVYLLGLMGAILIPGSAAASAMLPIVSVVLLLPGRARRHMIGILAIALAGSALALALGNLPHPFPPIREPLGTAFASASLLGVALLILAALFEFASKTTASVTDLHLALESGVASFAERTTIVASIGRLEPRATVAATAEGFVEALMKLPDVDIAGVFARTDDRLEILAMTGPPGFPLRSGAFLPEARALHLLGRSGDGPWAERWVNAPAYGEYGNAFSATGIIGQAYAPFYSGNTIIGIVAIGTRSEAHVRHLLSDLPAVAEFAATASLLLGPLLAKRQVDEAGRGVITTIIETGAFRPVLQPIVELATGRTVGFEALTRFADGRRPDHVFAAATQAGLGLELEIRTLEAAIQAGCNLPPRTWLSLNVSPELVVDASRLAAALARRDRPIVLEITEHVPIDDYRAVRSAIDRLGADVRVAVDDAGAGIANFSHLAELRPHLVKVDAGLIRDLDTDLARQAVVVGFVHFAARADCGVIAEGIETAAERDAALALGVALGQGFLFARPASVEDLRIECAAAGAAVGPGRAANRTARRSAGPTGVANRRSTVEYPPVKAPA